MKSVLATLLIALLALGGERALAQGNLSGYQKAITYLDVDNERHVWVFTETLDGRMVSKHFDGASWVWMNHGKPPGSTLVANSQPVTYQDANGNRRIYVFAVDNHGELVVRYYKSALSGWQWAKQGGPSLFGATLSAITFVDDDGVRHISAFAIRRLDGGPLPYRAMTNHWNGSSWEWTALFDVATSHAAPSFTTVTTYIDFQGHRRVSLYIADSGDDLVAYTWLQGNWSWGDPNLPAAAPAVAFNFVDDEGYRRGFAVVRDPDSNDIFQHRGVNDTTVLNHPVAVGGSALQGLSLINYTESGNVRLDLFANYHGSNVLFRRSEVNDTWFGWYQIALPPGSPQAVYNPNAMTYLESRGGLQHKYVFMLGPGYHLWAYFWNGMSWQWIDLGTPP